ncbi:PepSY domain-containing protein [Georgenia sp. MJ173]|uniref:PepSY domain-containing protein n=1 Tax=Georgenia sunbinii TaxID=3117728 RepID=UPI002F26094E
MKKHMRTRSVLTATAALALAVPLASCGDSDDDGSEASPAITGGTSQESTPAADDTASPSETTASADETGGTDGAEDAQAAEVAAAISLAESDAGGTAFEIDREDDGRWEISVAVDRDEIDVIVSADGTEVLDSRADGSADDDEVAALDAATVGLAEAIATALTEVPGRFDDASLDEEHGDFAWEVSIDRTDGDDVDVYVAVTSGEVLHVDR